MFGSQHRQTIAFHRCRRGDIAHRAMITAFHDQAQIGPLTIQRADLFSSNFTSY
jgi:hypothetical protein